MAHIGPLANLYPHAPGVVVSAGPSLSRNVDLLRGQEQCFPIAATQTVLRYLLHKGIKPRFVCAIDYHPISARFYEGITKRDVHGTTLVCQAACHPSIPKAWPGEVLFCGNDLLDQILGLPPSPTLPAVGTVALLCYHLLRYCGCDPVILVGQDLAFTDGQYYHAGAAIHDVWASELGEFNSLEAMEHQRIVRNKHTNTTIKDRDGNDITTDAQMQSYAVEMSTQFLRDKANGLVTVDATEGGCAKDGVEYMTLRAAMDKYGGKPVVRSKPEFVFKVLGDEVQKARILAMAGASHAELVERAHV